MLYLLDFDRNDSKVENAGVTGGEAPSALEEQPDKEPINPTNAKDFSLLLFVKQCDQTSSIFFHLLLPPLSFEVCSLDYKRFGTELSFVFCVCTVPITSCAPRSQ